MALAFVDFEIPKSGCKQFRRRTESRNPVSKFQAMPDAAAGDFEIRGPLHSGIPKFRRHALHPRACLAPAISWVFWRLRIICTPGSACRARFRNFEIGARGIPKSPGPESEIFEIALHVPNPGAIQLNCACFARGPFRRISKSPVPISKSPPRLAIPGNA